MKIRIEAANGTTTDTKLKAGTTEAQAKTTAETLKSVGAKSVQLFEAGKAARFL